MTDYKKLGFKSGLEIHQQLDTLKLFCGCPSLVHDDSKHTINIKRILRPVAGEKGTVDVAALHEQKKGKYFVYEASTSSSCLVEIDEEPPHPLNLEALEIALQVAKMLGMHLVPEVHVMRKIVVDGSNVSGFQRTALVAINGFIETSKGRVNVDTLCLEEESAQKIEDGENFTSFRLDRLGVPLIEIATDASLQDPEHVKEAAEKLGMILRSTGKVKRGIGTIRQDVNVSISGGARVEIKGFQELKSIPKVIEFEIERQLKLVKEGKPVPSEVRNAKPDFTTQFLRPMPGADRMYPETDIRTTRITKAMLDRITIPELLEDKIGGIITQYQLDKDIAATLVKDNLSSFFEFSVKRYPQLKPAFIADVLLSTPKQVKKQFNKEIAPTQEEYSVAFKALNEGKLAKESLVNVFGSAKPVKEALLDHQLMSDDEVLKKLKAIVNSNKGLPFNALIGKAMAELRGKADGKKIVDLLKTLNS